MIPAISVIMAVYNREEYLEECVRSILDQSFTDFEFVIVNDASTDPKVATTLDRLAKEDSRIRVLTNEENKERTYSRNRAIHAAKAPYVAVMDSDDVAFPERLAKQYAFMEANPHVTLCAAQQEGYENRKAISLPCTDADIRANNFFSCNISHSTVFFRKEPFMAYTQGYDENIRLCEDYELWVRLCFHKDVHIYALPDILVRMRKYPSRFVNELAIQDYGQIQEVSDEQANVLASVYTRLYTQLGIDKPKLAVHAHISQAKSCKDAETLHECGKWMCKVLEANEKHAIYNKEAFAKAFLERWVKMCYKSLIKVPAAWSIYSLYRPKPVPLSYLVFKNALRSIRRRVYALKKRMDKT